MQKTVLVICSSSKGSDFPRQDNQIMLKQLLGQDYIAEFLGGSGLYPQDLPTGKTFDAILFAGCNVLTWLFGENRKHEVGMKTLSGMLKEDGVIIFVENRQYVEMYSGKEHYTEHSLSIPIKNIKIQPVKLNDEIGLKENIKNSWNKYFTETQVDRYIVYKKVKTAGKRKRLTVTRKRKRKTRYSK